MRHDLIDEYRIHVHPVVIGQGEPLFPPSAARISLQLIETGTFGNGVVLLRYQRLTHPRGNDVSPALPASARLRAGTRPFFQDSFSFEPHPFGGSAGRQP